MKNHQIKRDLKPYEEYVKKHFNQDLKVQDGGCVAFAYQRTLFVPTHFEDELQMGILASLAGACLYIDADCAAKCETIFEKFLFLVIENRRAEKIVRQHFPSVIPDLDIASKHFKKQHSEMMSGTSPYRLIYMIYAYLEGHEIYVTDEIQEAFEHVKGDIKAFNDCESSNDTLILVQKIGRKILNLANTKIYGFEFNEKLEGLRQNAHCN